MQTSALWILLSLLSVGVASVRLLHCGFYGRALGIRVGRLCWFPMSHRAISSSKNFFDAPETISQIFIYGGLHTVQSTIIHSFNIN